MHRSLKKSRIIRWDKFINANAVVIIGLMIFLSSSAWAGPITDQLKGSLDEVIKVLNDPALKSPDKKNERRDILRKLVKEIFDEEAIARRALGVHWRKRTKEEKQEFVKTFSKLLERTYFEKLDRYIEKTDSFSRENIIYLNETVGEHYAVVKTRVKVDRETEVPVHYRLINKQGNWFVCDIAIEGISIVKNYRVQFNEILANSSFEDLMAKLKSKEQEG